MDKTDEEIYQAAMEEWTATLAQLWDAYDKQLDARRMLLYRNSLSGVPLGLLERAVNRTIKEHEYNTVPTLGEVWLAIKAELKKDDIHCETMGIDAALETWVDRRCPFAVLGALNETL